MKILSALSLTLLFISCLAQSNPTTPTTTSEGPTSNPTTTPNVPTTTPNVPTTTSSAAPPTTTPEPTTTTTPVPTTSPPTTTSSEAPPTTTSSAPTTPPVTTNEPMTTTSTPVPVPQEGTWNVTSGNTTCIRAEMKILFKISFRDGDSYIALNPNASSEGSNCELSNTTQELVLTDSNYNLRFIFERSSDVAYVRNISFAFALPEGSETVENNTRLFSVTAGNSYMCTETDNVILGNVTMEIMSIKLQAFGSSGNTDFGTAEECAADNKVNDIVPIAVGIALLALVVIVLVAYLIGRRRSRQKGYQSV